MGSLRNPIGPLPSSIYWRRRAVAVSLAALIAVLVVWAVTSGGGKSAKSDARPGGPGPASEITPGPGGTGPAITQQPGGRDEPDDSGGDGGATGAGSGDAGSGSGSTDAGGGTQTEAGDTGGSGSGSGSGGTAGQQVPASSPLPDCTPEALRISLSTQNSYAPGQKPEFRLAVRNTSAATCKADLGPRSAVLTVTEAGGDDSQVWSSKDCPRAAAPLLLKVPAGGTVVHAVEWDRHKSSPRCATPPAGTAGPGTYLVEAKAPGEPVQRASFVLAKD
ncbi:hypothetical protein ACFVWY_23045 [Streptomyces sp. NPDC058195]|uniref:hypothetical protein n=1 Tax=Streptomyces sp. NPDC058195 TaxID=3346375 RepID=UPI0036EB3319